NLNPRYEAIRPQIARWESFCGELGDEPAAVALAWLLAQKGVTAPIIGPRTLEQLEGAPLRAIEIDLEEDALKELDAIFPGPGGPRGSVGRRVVLRGPPHLRAQAVRGDPARGHARRRRQPVRPHEDGDGSPHLRRDASRLLRTRRAHRGLRAELGRRLAPVPH